MDTTFEPTSPVPRKNARASADWIAVSGIILGTLLAYSPMMRAGYVWDDDDHVTNNKTLRTAAGLHDIWFKPTATPQYYPMVHTVFWLEFHLWGLKPLGYHVVNVVLHVLTALMLWRVGVRLVVPGAAWIALIFSLHPVGVESVAWITELKNVLSTLFYFLAMDAYLRYWPAGEDAPHRPRVYWAAVVLFAAALLSKTVACSLPAVLLLIIWWKQGRVTWRRVVGLLPMFAIGAAAGIFTVILERTQVGASGADWALVPSQRIIIAGRAVWFYLCKVLWPDPLIFIYPRWEVPNGWSWQLAFPAAVVVVLAVFWAARGRIRRAPLALSLIFVVTLFPALGFFNTYPMRYSFVADHFQYVAQIAVIVAVVATIAQAWSNRALAPAAVCVAVVLACLTYRHAQAFADSRTLWTDTLARNDRAWIAWHNLGAQVREEGQTDKAIEMFQNVLELHPNDQRAYNQLGLAYADKHDDERAIECFQNAMRIAPNDYATLMNYSTAAGRQGDFVGSEALSRRAIQLKPGEAAAYTVLGQALGSQGRMLDAEAALQKAVELDPHSPLAHLGLAMLLANEGKLDAAIRECRAALAADANCRPASEFLVRLLRDSGHTDEARREETRIAPAR